MIIKSDKLVNQACRSCFIYNSCLRACQEQPSWPGPSYIGAWRHQMFPQSRRGRSHPGRSVCFPSASPLPTSVPAWDLKDGSPARCTKANFLCRDKLVINFVPIHLHHLQTFSLELLNPFADIIPYYPCFSQCFQWFPRFFAPFSKHYLISLPPKPKPECDGCPA